jgi:epoxyqueuosine reductase
MRLAKLEERGLLARAVPISRLDDLRRSIEGLHQAGMLDEEFYQAYPKRFVFSPPDSMPGTQSIIIVASRMPGIRFIFDHKGIKMPVYIPPTYIQSARSDRHSMDTLAEIIAPYRVVPAELPKKLLAARSGLATYGRNNITYIDGMGSYYWLSAFYTDMPCADDVWLDLTIMESCKDCRICLDNCPAGAITGERFLLHAERCIVYHNEKPGNVPFPEWMDVSWHNCLIGCLRCQENCPQSKGMLDTVEAAEFSQEETELLLAGTPQERLPAPLLKKLEEWDLMSSIDIIPRNLRALLAV